ncbi:MAG: fused MFS/spermidine synthase [Alphaproteobacteria bacterium]|nr:fused MFS/spermidine synthase [Alphaproteobacteria bacterium]
MPVHALTIFLGSFLLFLVQPLVARQALPWFGGASAVWTTCLVFFQCVLLAGYAYADFVTRRMAPRPRALLHGAILLVSLAWLPVLADPSWKPSGEESPTLRIIGFLAATIGLPFAALSANSPLVQAWFARANPGASPYRLFALSNLASLLALLGYPLLLEPTMATKAQAWLWSGGYVLFVAVALFAAWRDSRLPATPVATVETTTESGAAPSARDYALWTTLAAIGSILLLAVSNHLTQNVAAVPLLWVLPLALYLITFILTFESAGWYRPAIFMPLLGLLVAGMCWALLDDNLRFDLVVQVSLFSAGMFVGCMVCHGELVRAKPSPRHLTGFYLTIALGGAVGAALVGILAPLVLPDYFELEIGLVALLVLAMKRTGHAIRYARIPLLLGLIGVAFAVGIHVQQIRTQTLLVTRNFYGVLRVNETGQGAERERGLSHGAIVHGRQYLTPERRYEPSVYYRRDGGAGRAIEAQGDRPLRIGVIGLGAGALAAYGKPGGVIRFYEINQKVIDIAQRDFTYLADSKAKVETVLGDARLKLEREAPQNYDVLAIDAFSGDSIPIHLITVEALDLYIRHIRKDGVIAFHISNRFLDLRAPLLNLARARGLIAIRMLDARPEGGRISEWVLMTTDKSLLEHPRIKPIASGLPDRPEVGLWSDDFNSILRVIQ